jgi:hypothetical protein
MSKVVELAAELYALKIEKESISESEKVINKRIEEISKQLLPDAMDEDGISNIKIDGVGRISLRGEVYVSILAENREQAYQWMRDTGRGSLIVETVNASSLKAAAKAWLKGGEEIPENLIKVTPITIAVLTKA